MRLTRTHIDQPLRPGATVTLDADATAHLVRVLRHQVGDAVVVFNGDGHDYPARLVSTAKRGAEVAIESARPVPNESPLQLTLVQALARGEKMDWVLQKATELGVSRIVPVHTERTGVKLAADRAERRLAHWRGVVISACEQSGRARVPELEAPIELAMHAARRAPGTLGLALDPCGEVGLGSLAVDAQIELVVGPEGGLSERDLATLAAAGYRGLRLGPRILRTETAGLAAIAALQAIAGDFAG